MKLKELLMKNRSYRRFYQEEKVDIQDLKEMISNVRLIPSAANLQPLKFILVNNEKVNREIFKNLKWAGYIEDWDGPEHGERPSSYIVVLGNKEISSFHCDCMDKPENQKLWKNNPRRKLERIKLRDTKPKKPLPKDCNDLKVKTHI